MATFSVINNFSLKIVTLRTNAQRLSYSNFLLKTAIHTEKFYKNINSTDPNTSSNSMRSYLVYLVKRNTKLIKPQKNDTNISPK